MNQNHTADDRVKQIAAEYGEQRARVLRVPRRPGGSDWALKQELSSLVAIAERLYAAEREAGIPVGSTRDSQLPFRF
jgi:hypothetical protein